MLAGAREWCLDWFDDYPRRTRWTRWGRRERGLEICWSREGRRLWSWDHRADGTSIWTQWWPSGQKKAESAWRSFSAYGLARRWDANGTLAVEMSFKTGRPAAATSAAAE